MLDGTRRETGFSLLVLIRKVSFNGVLTSPSLLKTCARKKDKVYMLSMNHVRRCSARFGQVYRL